MGIFDADVYGPSLPTMISPELRVLAMDPETKVGPGCVEAVKQGRQGWWLSGLLLTELRVLAMDPETKVGLSWDRGRAGRPLTAPCSGPTGCALLCAMALGPALAPTGRVLPPPLATHRLTHKR